MNVQLTLWFDVIERSKVDSMNVVLVAVVAIDEVLLLRDAIAVDSISLRWVVEGEFGLICHHKLLRFETFWEGYAM